MARLARFPDLSHADAVSALKWLVATKRISVLEIRGALAKRDQLLTEIRERIEQLGGEGLRYLKGAVTSGPRRTRARRRKASPKAVAAWKAQGRYMAAVRRLPKAARTKVRAVREKKGLRAALAEAKRLAR